MPEAGYFTNMGLVFPARENRDSDGVIRRGKEEFPLYNVSSFTTEGTLYKIEFWLWVKVSTPLLTFQNYLATIPRRYCNGYSIGLGSTITSFTLEVLSSHLHLLSTYSRA
jgi:hypothetical protein